MYSKLAGFLSIFLSSSIVFPLNAAEQKSAEQRASADGDLQINIQIRALPEQCVTLRQGRDCFAEVNIHWESQHKQTLCLYQEGLDKHLKCWRNNESAHIAIDFVSNKSINYQLRNLNDNKLVAETQVTVSWLHKSSNRKRRWRLF